MPIKNNKEITPDEAIKGDLCPECARDLTELDVDAESKRHWPMPPPPGPEGDEARRRIALMKDYASAREAKVKPHAEPEPQTEQNPPPPLTGPKLTRDLP
jgi:hypothetical protein